MNVDLSVALNAIVVRCDHLFSFGKKNEETGLGSEKKRKKSVSKSKKNVCVWDKQKSEPVDKSFIWDIFLHYKRMFRFAHAINNDAWLCLCVSYSTDQSMGSCFFHLCHICSHADLSLIFFFFKSPLTKKMRMGPNRIHLKRGRYEKKCTDFKLLFRSYSLGNKNILHVTRKLI